MQGHTSFTNLFFKLAKKCHSPRYTGPSNPLGELFANNLDYSVRRPPLPNYPPLGFLTPDQTLTWIHRIITDPPELPGEFEAEHGGEALFTASGLTET